MQVVCGKGWVTLGVATVVTAAPSPHPLRTGPGHPVRGGRWARPSNSENGSEPLAGALFIFIFIFIPSRSQVGLRHASTHTFAKVNVGGARAPQGRCRLDFTSRLVIVKTVSTFVSGPNAQSGAAQVTL